MDKSTIAVSGPLSPGSLGLCLCYEHILSDVSSLLFDPSASAEVAEAHISLENRGYFERHPLCSRVNLKLDSIGVATSELGMLAREGPCTVVDASLQGMGRNPDGLALVSRDSGVAVIMSSGFFPCQLTAERKQEELADAIVDEIKEGISTSSGLIVKAGVIGCVLGMPGIPWEHEEKLIRATSNAQARTDAPLILDIFSVPGEDMEGWMKKIQHILIEEEVELKRTMVSVGFPSMKFMSLYKHCAGRGMILSFRFGGLRENYTSSCSPAEGGRVLAELEKCGLTAANVVISLGTTFKTELVRYGGHGYKNFVDFVVPGLLQVGVSASAITSMTRDTPKRVLSWWMPPKPTVRQVKYLKCQYCGSEYEEGKGFERMGVLFCSINCLTDHRKANSTGEKRPHI